MGKSHDFPFGIMDVAELLNLRIRRPYAKGFYADCPICGDKRGKMSLSTELDAWRCNYCGEHGGMLDLYARIYNISNSEAYREICEALQNGDFESNRKEWTPVFPFSIMDVAELLHLRIHRPYAKGFYADCPICGDKQGKMSLNTELDSWHCNCCSEHGGMLDLYARVYNLSDSEAYRKICEALLSDDFEPNGKEWAFAYKRQKLPFPPKQSELSDARTIHQTYSMLLEMLTLSKKHREHLRTVRGLTDEQIAERGYKSTPPFYLCRKLTERLLEKGCTVQGVPGFYQKDGHWTVKFYTKIAGILIPARGIDSLIRGLQIRLDVPIKDENDDPDKEGAKYIWLSSSNKEMGVSSGSPVHFVGDPMARTVFVTEGLLKADVAHYLMNRTFAAVAGANNTAGLELLFQLLAENGTELIVEAQDMDKYRNEQVDKGASKIYLLAKQCGLQFRRLTWNPNYKGIDDWQLALKRKQSGKEEYRMNFKQRYIYGLCDFDAIDDEIEAWHEDAERSETLEERLGFTSEEYASFLQEDEDSFARYLLSLRKQQGFRIYQLDFSDGRTKKFAFEGLKGLQKAGYEQPPASEYALVCEDTLLCCQDDSEQACLERIFDRYNGSLPDGYSGRSMAPSDVVELYGENGRKYFYRDKDSFCPVKFSPMLAKKQKK